MTEVDSPEVWVVGHPPQLQPLAARRHGPPLEDIRRALAELGPLREGGGWLLPGGAGLLGAAAARQRELEGEQRRREEALAGAEDPVSMLLCLSMSLCP